MQDVYSTSAVFEIIFLNLSICSLEEEITASFPIRSKKLLTRLLMSAVFWFSSNNEMLLDFKTTRLWACLAIHRCISMDFFSRACGVIFLSLASSCFFNFSLAFLVFKLSSAICFFLSKDEHMEISNKHSQHISFY